MNQSGFFNYPGEPAHTPPPKITFWATRSQRDWRKLLDTVQTLRFRAGETAVSPHTPSTGLYLIGFGRFQEGNHTAEEGQLLGLIPFFTRQQYPHPIIAQTDGELLHLSYSALEVFAAREPELARVLLFECGRILAHMVG